MATRRAQRASGLFGAEYKKVTTVLASLTGELFEEAVHQHAPLLPV